jgi:hypothetical protein
MIPKHEVSVPHEVILVDVEPEMPQPYLYHPLIRAYEESLHRMMEGLDDLDDDPNEGHSDMDDWFFDDGINDRD